MSVCVLEEETFHRCCQLLLHLSDQLGDGWSWESVQGMQEGYLRKTALRSVSTDSSLVWDQAGSSLDSDTHTHQQQEDEQSAAAAAAAAADDDDDDDDDDDLHGDIDDDEDDGVHMVPEGSSRVLQYEYHIVYSCSYSVPVLYFRASTLEGKSLSLEALWRSVHPNFRSRLQNSPLNTITQQEHPVLGQPFFMLHPCKTEEFMRPVLQAAQDEHRPVNYVLTWLSLVGPVVGLDVPLTYCTQLHPAASPNNTEPD